MRGCVYMPEYVPTSLSMGASQQLEDWNIAAGPFTVHVRALEAFGLRVTTPLVHHRSTFYFFVSFFFIPFFFSLSRFIFVYVYFMFFFYIILLLCPPRTWIFYFFFILCSLLVWIPRQERASTDG